MKIRKDISDFIWFDIEEDYDSMYQVFYHNKQKVKGKK